MTNYELLSIVMSIIALVVATIGTSITFGRLNVAKRALRKASKAEKVAQGQLKMNVRDRISAARIELMKAKMLVEEFKEQFPDKSIEKRQQFFNSNLENFFNSYETACNLYFRENIDKEDFKDEYREEIRDLIENEKFRKYFDPTISRYQSMIRAYKEWEKKG